MAEYGFSQEEWNEAIDHRFYMVFRDLTAYRKARNRIPAVKEIPSSQSLFSRASGGWTRRKKPPAKHKQGTSTLRKTGSFEAGVGALMDLDL
jgi:hypothetical protein